MTEIKPPPYHYGQYHANQHLDWLPTDTKENYEKLIQDSEHRQYFAKLGWDQPGAITYKINSHGFRSDEFDGGPYLVALGCSYTVGIGLPVEATWPYLVGQALGLKVANLAWGGYSIDTCFRLAEYWIPELKPDLVIMLAPPRHRVELMLDQTQFDINKMPVEIFMPESQSSHFRKDDWYLKHWFLAEENARINQTKNSLAIQQLCADLDIPCQVHKAENHMWWSREEIGYARDYMHGGPKIHTIIAEIIIDGCKK
jgi:hypothetical protein